MAIHPLFEGTVPKRVESPGENEDVYRLDPEKGRLVVSDGASESFDARNWARVLVDQAIREDLTLTELDNCLAIYKGIHDLSTLSWSKAAAYERGSFATLLIAQDKPEYHKVHVFVIGDSFAVWAVDGEMLTSTPYSHSKQFQERPTLLATRPEMNVFNNDTLVNQTWSYETGANHVLLCMTDALGAWLLAHQECGDPSALTRLCNMREHGAFVDLVESERAASRLKRDDTTLIVACVTQS